MKVTQREMGILFDVYSWLCSYLIKPNVSFVQKAYRVLVFLCVISAFSSLEARETYNFNSHWRINDCEKYVTLPHAWNEDESFRVRINDMSDTVVWYRKSFDLPKNISEKRVIIEFEGVRQAAFVTVNGHFVGLHENGVTAFGFDITPYVNEGKNFIEVKTDNNWGYTEVATGTTFQWNNKNFYANYGGLNKNVWLHIVDNIHQTLPLYSNLKTTGVYIYAKNYDVANRKATICVESEVKNETNTPVMRRLNVSVMEREGRGGIISEFKSPYVTIPANGTAILKGEAEVEGLHFWSWGYGYLYDVKTMLEDNTSDNVYDPVITVTGFRQTEFNDGLIRLNGRIMMVHGYAQRTTNEWAGVGMSVPAWLSDYSNDLMVNGGANVVRWMHVAPWRQDVESCDRVGLLQAMPAGDAEQDTEGRKWEQREEAMRDAIIYFRNNPSIIFYECGNKRISTEHMIAMKAIRDKYDPNGGRAIGSREMLDVPEAEYGGEMLYINKSSTKPMWSMEYCRDEALRWYWNSWSYPYHEEGDGPLYRGASAHSYNHNNDEFVAELVDRWYEYWLERPGSGTKVNSGGVKIVFSDTQTHGRSADNYRVSGVVDPMRLPKDAFFAHQVMWNGWVDDFKDATYIVGHWNYKRGFIVPTIYVVSTSDSVVLVQGNNRIVSDEHRSRFLHVFKNVEYTNEKLVAIGLDRNGHKQSSYTLETSGSPFELRLTAIENPTGWKADGNDVALVQVEVVDSAGRRCPLDNRLIKFTLKGSAEWRGGVAKGKDNHVLCDTLPVECGVNRVMLRSLDKAGKVELTASADGMKDVTISLKTNDVDNHGGLSSYFPSQGLPSKLDRGETPSEPSCLDWRREVAIKHAVAGSGSDPMRSFDGLENTTWSSANKADSAWITYTLAERASVDEICMKMNGFRQRSYHLEIFADTVKVWEGWTPKCLGFTHIPIVGAPETNIYTIRTVGQSVDGDAFSAVKELDVSNDEKVQKGGRALKIIEIEFLKNTNKIDNPFYVYTN